MKTLCLLIFIFGALRVGAIDMPVFGTRETITSALGDASEPVEHATAALPNMEVRRFKKDGWVIVIYFTRDISARVVITKQDNTALTDQDIAAFLTPLHADWQTWKIPNRRAWFNNNKGGPEYALVTKDNKALEILSAFYLQDLGRHTWLDSADPNQ